MAPCYEAMQPLVRILRGSCAGLQAEDLIAPAGMLHVARRACLWQHVSSTQAWGLPFLCCR